MCSDTHSSLDMSRYDGDMDIVRFAIGNNWLKKVLKSCWHKLLSMIIYM
jgi:hypothetical protein